MLSNRASVVLLVAIIGVSCTEQWEPGNRRTNYKSLPTQEPTSSVRPLTIYGSVAYLKGNTYKSYPSAVNKGGSISEITNDVAMNNHELSLEKSTPTASDGSNLRSHTNTENTVNQNGAESLRLQTNYRAPQRQYTSQPLTSNRDLTRPQGNGPQQQLNLPYNGRYQPNTQQPHNTLSSQQTHSYDINRDIKSDLTEVKAYLSTIEHRQNEMKNKLDDHFRLHH